MEAFMYKLHPKWRHARAQLKVGEIGELQAVQCFFSYSLFDPENIRNKPETGGGAIPDIGCYAVSSARFLTGREPVRCLSLVHRDPSLGTDILSTAILDFGTLRAVFTVGTQTFPYQAVQVFGSGGNLTIENPFNIYPDVPGKVIIHNFVGMREIFTEAVDQYGIEFEEFSLAVRGEGPIPTDPEDAVLNQKVLDALFKSEKTGTWVDI
jgi:predicted dehydrogenase